MPLLVTQLALRDDFKKQFKAKTLMNGVYHKPVHKLLFSYHVYGKSDRVTYPSSTQLRFKIWWKKSRNFIKSLNLFHIFWSPQARSKHPKVPQIGSLLSLQANSVSTETSCQHLHYAEPLKDAHNHFKPLLLQFSTHKILQKHSSFAPNRPTWSVA